MGLNMFLDYRRIADSIPGKPTLNEHMYWRKANAIHARSYSTRSRRKTTQGLEIYPHG